MNITTQQVEQYFFNLCARTGWTNSEKNPVWHTGAGVYGEEPDYTICINVKELELYGTPAIRVSCYHRQITLSDGDGGNNIEIEDAGLIANHLNALIEKSGSIKRETEKIIKESEIIKKLAKKYEFHYTQNLTWNRYSTTCSIYLDKLIINLEEDCSKVASFYEEMKGLQIKMSGAKIPNNSK